MDAFRTHIMQTKDLGTCPVRQIGGCSFLYMRISNVYIVTVVSSNANAACAFKFVVEVCPLLSKLCQPLPGPSRLPRDPGESHSYKKVVDLSSVFTTFLTEIAMKVRHLVQ